MPHSSDRDPSLTDEIHTDLRDAYERGRRDAQISRRRHPFLMTLTVLAAAVGVVVIALALVNGSFGIGGKVVDQNLAAAADEAAPIARKAVGQARDAVQDVSGRDRVDGADKPR